MLSASVIIATYERPSELKSCIQSLLDQTVKPFEIVVVDDGALPGFPLEDQAAPLGIRAIYHRKTSRGLPESRNIGSGLASGEIIFFFDDDVVLFPDYLDEILKIYESDRAQEIGGIGGAAANPKSKGIRRRLRRAFDTVFLVRGFREGRILPSGFATDFGEGWIPISRLTTVDFLSGCAMSYRKKVFKEFSFDPSLALREGEDKDFSYRVSQKYTLLIHPKARFWDKRSPLMRPAPMEYGRMFVTGRHLFFKRYLAKGAWSRGLFYYALFGYVLSRILVWIFSWRKDHLLHLKGVWTALREIWRAKE